MANIQIYGSIEDASIHFDNSTVSPKPLNSVESVAHPTEVDRIIIRSTVPKNNGTFQTYFRRFDINRIENKDGVILTTALGMDRTQVLAYLNAEFNKSLAETNAVYRGTWDAATNTPDLDTASNVEITIGDTYTVTADGLFFTEQVRIGDFLIAEVSTAAGAGSALSNWTVVQSNIDIATAAATSGAAVKGIAGYDSADFTVDATGYVQLQTKTYATSIGDGSATSYTVTHNLNSFDVVVQLYDLSSYDTVYADVVRTSLDIVTVSFTTAPTTNDIRVLIQEIEM